MMRLGYRLSCSAFPSRKNSGEKIIFKFVVFSCSFSLAVYPTGTVLLIIIVAFGLIFDISFMTDSTLLVSK